MSQSFASGGQSIAVSAWGRGGGGEGLGQCQPQIGSDGSPARAESKQPIRRRTDGNKPIGARLRVGAGTVGAQVDSGLQLCWGRFFAAAAAAAVVLRVLSPGRVYVGGRRGRYLCGF